MRRTTAGRVTPAVLFAVWVLSTFLVVTLSVAQTPSGEWSAETQIAANSGAAAGMYYAEPPMISLAADSLGRWHLAYQSTRVDETWHWSGGLTYANASGVSEQLASFEGYWSPLLSRPGIAVDPDDNPAIVYGVWNWPVGWNLYLLTGLGDPEPTSELIASGLAMYQPPPSEPSLCFDPEGNWHVAYAAQEDAAGGTEYRIYHLSDGATEVAASALAVYGADGLLGSEIGSPSISADPDGYLHIAFVRDVPGDASTLEVTDNTSGAWSLPQTLFTLLSSGDAYYMPYSSDSAPRPSLVMDGVGNWNLAWLDGYQVDGVPYEDHRYLMLAAAGTPAASLAESLSMYGPPDGWTGDRLGPVALAQDPGGAWHLAYARTEAAPAGQEPGWEILYRRKGLPGGYYWCHLAGPTNLAPGQAAAYTVSYGVSVSDPGACTWPVDVTITADLPDFLTYLSDTSGLPGTVGAHHCSWQASLLPNQPHSFTVTASVPAGTASAVGEFALGVAGDYFASGAAALPLRVVAPEVDLMVVKSVSGGVRPGFYGTYVLAIFNAGNATAQNVWVEDSLPAQLTYVSCSGGGSYDASRHRVVWYLGNMGPGGFRTVDITFATPVGLPLGTVVRNTMWATSSDGLEANHGNNAYTLDSTVRGSWDPNDKRVAPTGAVAAGQRLTYFIEFENEGTAEAVNVRVTDSLSPNLDDTTLLGLSPEAHYDASTRQLTWDFPEINLPPGESRVLTFSICTDPGLEAGTDISNQAQVYFDFNPPVATPVVTNTIGGGAMHLRLFLTPRVLNLRSPGKTVTAKLEVEGDYRLSDIDLASLRLLPGNLAPLQAQVGTIDTSGGGKQALAVTFDRQLLQNALPETDPTTVAVLGTMKDGTPFTAADSIRMFGF